MAKVIGLVNLHSDIEFTGLTERRPVASVSFLGRYGIIDFVLSNMSNSKIDAIGVMIQKKPRSLFKHLGNGNSWNFNQKAGGVSLLYNEKAFNKFFTLGFIHIANSLPSSAAGRSKSSVYSSFLLRLCSNFAVT